MRNSFDETVNFVQQILMKPMEAYAQFLDMRKYVNNNKNEIICDKKTRI